MFLLFSFAPLYIDLSYTVPRNHQRSVRSGLSSWRLKSHACAECEHIEDKEALWRWVVEVELLCVEKLSIWTLYYLTSSCSPTDLEVEGHQYPELDVYGDKVLRIDSHSSAFVCLKKNVLIIKVASCVVPCDDGLVVAVSQEGDVRLRIVDENLFAAHI